MWSTYGHICLLCMISPCEALSVNYNCVYLSRFHCHPCMWHVWFEFLPHNQQNTKCNEWSKEVIVLLTYPAPLSCVPMVVTRVFVAFMLWCWLCFNVTLAWSLNWFYTISDHLHAWNISHPVSSSTTLWTMCPIRVHPPRQNTITFAMSSAYNN